MKWKYTLLLWFHGIGFISYGQTNSKNHLDILGYQLGQFREAISMEYANPVKSERYEDGYEYEIYLVRPDTSAYLMVEYAPNRTDVIWSLQLSGKNNRVETGFKNLKLGDEMGRVLEVLGEPSSKKSIGAYGEQWNYDSTNYSIEISIDGKLSSIKIRDLGMDELPNVNEVPSFETFLKKINVDSHVELAQFLAPGIEVNVDGKLYFFKRSIKREIESDFSEVFSILKKLRVGLNKINTKDKNVYEESMRLTMGHNPKHVIKIKKNHPIREIVLEYTNGEYLIWEIKASEIQNAKF